MPFIETIGILGAGTMGNGIAHVCARAGLNVILCDVSMPAVERGLATITNNLAREVAKGKLTQQQADEARARITTTTVLDALIYSHFVIEAATEKFEVKAQLFRDLDKAVAPETILASNTSSISITKLAAVTQRPEQVIGMHFFNPVPVMKLVEIIRGLQTSQATFDTVKTLSEKLGKIPVEVNDAAGFVSNRVLMPLINEACYAVMENVATPPPSTPSSAKAWPTPWAAHARRLHRSRRLRRHHARHGRRPWQPQIQPLPTSRPHGRRRMARPQIRQRLLHLLREITHQRYHPRPPYYAASSALLCALRVRPSLLPGRTVIA